MTYTKEQVIAIEIRKAKETVRDYEKAVHEYQMSRGCVSEESNVLLDNVFLHARVLIAHIHNLDTIDDTVKFYNTGNTIARY